jgi:hypothetical protein
LSKVAESDPSGLTTGVTFWRSSPKRSLASCDSLARIQLMLPLRVLISPLWAIRRNGWARSQLGKVLVENREWTRAMADSNRSSRRSGKKLGTWKEVSIPL